MHAFTKLCLHLKNLGEDTNTIKKHKLESGNITFDDNFAYNNF